MTAEERRLCEARQRAAHWKPWGPYPAEHQWGTVREDYSRPAAEADRRRIVVSASGVQSTDDVDMLGEEVVAVGDALALDRPLPAVPGDSTLPPSRRPYRPLGPRAPR